MLYFQKIKEQLHMSQNLNCLIVDDDPMSVKIIEKFVGQTDFLTLVTSCTDAFEASAVLKREKIDLIFLDVEMPEMTGIELIESLQHKPQIVLITSKEDYAVDAFYHEVTDYIVKPPSYPRFLKAANRALSNLEERSVVDVKQDSLFVKVDSQLVSIKMDSINMVEARADYVTIHTDNKRYTVYSTMKGIEAKLPPEDFLRVHRSFIVNKNRIDTIEDNTLVMGQKLIPVGVTYRERFMKKLNLL